MGKKWNGQIQRVAAKHVNIVDRVVDPVRPAPQPVLIRKVK